uniref:hypothetical protein n=1 Tax=Methanomethylovorans sp. TaxID=2758717 RepID=UPI00351C5E53
MQIKSNKLVCFGLVLFMIMTTGICSADSLSVEQVSHINGSDISIAIAGDYAYIGQNYDFVVVDIANPAEPIEIGRIVTPGLV